MIVKTAKRLGNVEEYYFSKKLREIASLEANGIEVINLGIGKPDLAPAGNIVNVLRERVLDPTNHGYQSYRGTPELRSAIGNFYQKYFDVSLNPADEILPLIGSKEGIMHINMAFLDPGDEVLVPNPGYPAYAATANLTGATVKNYELLEENNYQVSLDELKSLTTEKTKLLWINYPHMPTGAQADIEVLKKIVLWARAQNILVACDAPYSFILTDKRFSILSIPGAKDHCIELNSLSKSHGMSGWRVGMAMSGKEIIDSILRFKSNMDSGMFKPIMEAATAALQIDEIWYKTSNDIYDNRRKAIWNFLDKINFSYSKDSAGLFVWSKISDKFKSGEEASDYFLDKCRIFAPPGMIFGSHGDQYVRWSLCQDEEVIKEAGRRIISVMNF